MLRALPLLAAIWVWLAPSFALAIPRLVMPAAPLAINGVPEVGQVLSLSAVPPGATCSWKSGATQVSTSCTTYTVQAGDAGGTLTATVTTSGTSAYAALTISNAPPSTASLGTPYTYSGPTISGGSGGVTFVASGAFPTGLTFNTSTGGLSGSASALGTYSGLDICASDSVGGSACLAPFSISVTAFSQSLQFFFPDGQDLLLALTALS